MRKVKIPVITAGDDYNHQPVNYNPEDFPLEIFPERIKNLIIQLEQRMNFQAQTTAAGVLFAVSTAIGSRRVLHIKTSWRASASLWLAIVGTTGSNKSHPVNFAVIPLLFLEDIFNAEYKNALDAYNKLKDKSEAKEPVRKHIYTTNATTEGLTKALHYNPSGIGVHTDELKGLFESFNQYKPGGGGDQEFYLTAFDNGTISTLRATQDNLYVKGTYFPMIGSIQPEVLRGISKNNMDNGMLQRWLYVENLNHIPDFTMDEINSSEITALREFINNLYADSIRGEDDESDRNRIIELNFSESSSEYFMKKINAIRKIKGKDTTDKRLLSYLAKMETYYPRFINVISTMNGDGLTVSDESVFKANNLVDYFISSATNAFIEIDNQISIDDIFKKEKAINKTEKVKALLKHLPTLTNKAISDYCECTPAHVGKIKKEFTY